MTYDDEEVYRGEFKDGTEEGYGHIHYGIFKDNEYDGEWMNG